MQTTRCLLLSFGMIAGLSGCVPAESDLPGPTGQQDFAAYCSACHGAGGNGDGALAADLPKRPADLTGLQKANGGAFPTTRVMASPPSIACK